MRLRTWKRLLATSLALGAGTLIGCGGGGSGDDDGAPDAATDGLTPDTAPPTATRSATIAVTDVALTSNDGVAGGWRGGSISILFEDVTAGGGEVIYDTGLSAGCIVTKYDAAHPPHSQVDAGAVSLSGTGLLKTVGNCDYHDGMGYQCISDSGAETVSGTSSSVSPLVTYSYSGSPFAGQDLVGSYLSINGFTDDALNTGPSARPIVVQTDSSLTVISSGIDATPANNESAAAQFAVLNGAGPIPTQIGIPVDADFLGDETTSVQIQKDASAEWGATDFTTYTRGEGFTLDDASAKPHEFPSSAADMIFSCSGPGGDCGADGAGDLEAVIISGKTTDTTIPDGVPDFYMPAPTDTWVEFKCAYLLADSGTLPSAAVQAILDTNPTRVETRVLRVAGQLGNDPNNDLNGSAILVGHALVGHTSLTPL